MVESNGDFIPTEVHGIIIVNSVYDKAKVRNRYHDLEQVLGNKKMIRSTFEFLNIKEENITEFIDSKKEDFDLFF